MYRHTQTGTVILAAMGVGIVTNLLILFAVPFGPGEEFGRWIVALTLVILLAAASLFGSLTVTVDAGVLSWSFGPGLIRKSVPISEIARVERTRTSAFAGWGIHWTPRGWLYNVSGMEAVRVQLKSGKQLLLGTDEPEQLVHAIRAAQPHVLAQHPHEGAGRP